MSDDAITEEIHRSDVATCASAAKSDGWRFGRTEPTFSGAARDSRADMQRALGAYYTPDNATDWMAHWLVDDQIHSVLEPSCGDGAFVEALSRVAEANRLNLHIHAVELDGDALKKVNVHRSIQKIESDFHLVEPFSVDAAIGNPPFVRFRHLPTDADRKAARTAGSNAIAGVKIESSGSIWMTMVLHAVTFLKPGGRLAFVLPADALYVKYAKPFWRFMGQQFGNLRVVRCRERIFPQILQDVVLLLADQSGASTDFIEAELHRSLSELVAGQHAERIAVAVSDVVNGGKPFVRALLGERFGHSLRAFEERTVRADTYAKFNIGYVDANKAYFHPSVETQRAFDLPDRSLHRAAKNGRSMSGCGYLTSTLPRDAVTKLWVADSEVLTPGELDYIRAGEEQGAHTGFKARNRHPWYCVPDVRVPDLLMPVFGELPKMMLNDSGLVASNSLMLGFFRGDVDATKFLLVWYSSPTRLGIELSVHSLGGGVLVVVPSEADSVRMPHLPDCTPPSALLKQLDAALRAKDLRSAYRVGDEYLEQAGWPKTEIETARKMADYLLTWRVDR